MRAAVSRSPAQANDDWGRPGKPVFASAGSVPCFAWSKMRKEIRDEGKEVVIEDLRALVPIGADVTERDRLTIVDRLGATLFGGPVAVVADTRKIGHRELMLTRHV